ncbi:nicotinate-nucleotide adenylyltransferase [bacterium]|nr:nicotinate-nucleotide adenylyltransferase [bacterium]
MRIGLFGGTFDPIHTGHLIIAEAVRTGLCLDKIFFIPAGSPPHKIQNTVTEAGLRLEMVKIAIHDYPYFHVSDIEIGRKGKSFTIDTIRMFQNSPDFADDEFVLIIGCDNFLGLGNWYQPDEVLKSIDTVVAVRPGFDLSKAEKRFINKVKIIKTPLIDISSSQIRESVHNGESVSFWVPENVKQFIETKGLYR